MPSQRGVSRKWIALVAITLLAAFLRFHRIWSLPPGDGYDPAWYGVDALQILDGHLPVFLPTNIGREVMFSYLVAACVALFGIGPHAIHIAAAVAGTLTIPATYLALEALFSEETGWLARYGSLTGSLMLAVSHWHLHWSRYGVRAILVPLFTALTVWALMRAIQRRRRRDAVASGLFLGLSFYTYQSARTLPALVVVTLAGAVLSGRLPRREALRTLLITGVVALLVFAPMGVYFLTHPGDGSVRIEQTWIFRPELSLRENVQRVWHEVVDAGRVLAIEGDEEPIHNLPGRPAMNVFLLVLSGIGLLISLGRVRRLSSLVILAWLPVMSVTAFLTLGGQPTKRALGALPAMAGLVATGALAPLDAVALSGAQGRRTADGSPRWRRIAIFVGVAALSVGFAYSAWASYRDYFLIWGQDPNLFTHFEAGRAAIGAYARGLPPEERIYSSPEMPDHPSIVFNSGARSGMKGYNGRVCTVIPAEMMQPTTYIIVPHEDKGSLDRLASAFPNGQLVPAGPDYYGQPFFSAYRVAAGERAQIEPTHVAPASWEDRILFMGYDLSTEGVQPGETLALTLYHRTLAPIERAYIVFTHLLGPENPASGNRLWAQDDSEPCRTFYPTTVWSAGEIIRDVYTLKVPEDAPAGDYDLQMGFYTWPDTIHLTTEVSGEPAITHVFGHVTVGPSDS